MDTVRQDADLAFAGPLRLAELVRAGEVSPRELVESALDRIGRLDPQLNAFRVVLAEQALTEAAQAEGRRGAGDDRPLLGVPVAIKDDQPVAGQVRTMGTNAVAHPEPADADIVRRLRRAGAIVVGITNVPELCTYGFTESASNGYTRSPWNPQRTPGGSSGGSAAAIAAGLVPLATASDGAGSIRIPAANCGLFGLKPQTGRISPAPLVDPWHGLSTFGVLTRSVEDAAFAYEAITGEPWLAAARREPAPLRIAVSMKVPPGLIARVHPDYRRTVEDTAELLRGLGHEVVERDPDYALADGSALVARYLGGVYADTRTLDHPERLERRTKGYALLGRAVSPFVARARAHAAASEARVLGLFGVDVLLTPMMAGPPLPVGKFEGRPGWWVLNGMTGQYPFGGLWNHFGNPAASVPAGFDGDGLPLSVQLVGPRDGEPVLLSVARQIEQARPWTDRRPPIS